MDQYDLHKPDDEGDEGYDDWYRLIGPDPTPEELPDAPQAQPQDAAGDDDDDRGPIPFGEEGAAFLRNILQHGVFLGFVMVILMILHLTRPR